MKFINFQLRRFISKIRAILRESVPYLIDIRKYCLRELIIAIQEMGIDYINGFAIKEAYDRQIERTKERVLNDIYEKLLSAFS